MKIAVVSVGDRPHAVYCVKSFKEQMPEVEFVQLTDLDTPKIDGVDTVERRKYNGHMMLFMIESFSDTEWDDAMITTADDCIIDKPLYEELNGDYDVSIVKRQGNKDLDSAAYRAFPYTNGLVITKSKQFYKDCYRELLKLRGEQFRHWYYWDWMGDMACISTVLLSGKYNVHHLSEQMYSRIPKEKGEGKDGSSILWHYANKKKDWMGYHGKGTA